MSSAVRLLVGAERAGIGYGVFGLVGGGVAVIIPQLAGFFFTTPDDPIDTGVGLLVLLWRVTACRATLGGSPRHRGAEGSHIAASRAAD